MQNTQVIHPSDYDANNIIFSDPIQGNIPDSKPAISFQRINITTKNADGTIGELVIPTNRVFSFGVTENTSQETGKVNGWTFPLCLWSRDGVTEEEKKWTDTFNNIVDKCIDHIIDNKEELDKFDLERSDLKKFNPLYWRKEKKIVNGKTVMDVVDGVGPTLYSKLIYSKKSDKFLTKFFDINDNPIDPIDMQGKYCYTNSVVKIESIFIGNKISLQVKLYESVVEPIQSGMKRLIPSRQVSNPTVNVGSSDSKPFTSDEQDDGSDSDDGSIQDSPPKPIGKKVVVKRRVLKK